jgi:hypothetical protein
VHRGDRDDPEEVLPHPSGERVAGELVPLVAPARVVAPALVGEVEEVPEVVVDEGREPTGGIAPEKTLGATTGGSGQSRAQSGLAST